MAESPRGAKPSAQESAALGVLAAGVVGAGALHARGQAKPTSAPRAPGRVKQVAKTAVQGAGKGTKAAARVTGKVTAKTAVAAVPALGDLGKAVKNRKEIGTRAKQSAGTIGNLARGRKVDAAALAALTKDAGVLGNVAKNLALPALAGIAAITTYRDAIAKNKSGGEAAIDSGIEAADVVLGGALSTYSERRAAGDNKMVAAARAALAGLDRRFTFGLGQKAIDIQRQSMREIEARQDYELRQQEAATAENGMFGVPAHNQIAGSQSQGHDKTTTGIAEMGGQLPHQQDGKGFPGAGKDQAAGGKTAARTETPAGASAGPQRLDAGEVQKFHNYNRQFTQQREQTSKPGNPERPQAEEKPKSGRKPGFGPEARIAAYLARHPDGANVPYGGDPSTAPDFEPTVKGA